MTIYWRKSSHSGGATDEACIELARLIRWRKSSHSGTATDEACIELARMPATIGIRDSKNPHGPHLTITSQALADLLTEIKHDDRI